MKFRTVRREKTKAERVGGKLEGLNVPANEAAVVGVAVVVAGEVAAVVAVAVEPVPVARRKYVVAVEVAHPMWLTADALQTLSTYGVAVETGIGPCDARRRRNIRKTMTFRSRFRLQAARI